MRPYRLLEEEKEEEEDNSRKRNQFSKDERFVLLSIMGQYAPLLDDKSASVFDRREIWRAIERDFHRAGFTGKTSAQLKKYWQNYKYHGRRAQAGIKKHSSATSKHAVEEAPHPEVSENRDNVAMTKTAKERTVLCISPHNDASLRNVNDPGCRQCEIYEDNGAFFRKLSSTSIHPTDLDSLGKNRSSSDISQSKGFSSKVYEEARSSGVTDHEPEKPIGTDVIVSNTDISDNSVTVSVICPERTPELFSKNQSKRKRKDDASRLDRFSHQSDISAVSAASSNKKRGSDDQSIFPIAGSAKGRCFLLQPRQTDNYSEVISNRRDAIEIRRKLEPAKEGSILPSKFVSRSKVSCSVSAKKIPVTIKEDSAKENSVVPDIRDTVRDLTECCKGNREESKIDESAASGSQRDDSDRTANDAARSCIPNVRLWDQDEADLVRWELQDELNYRLTLHRLETEEKRLKVKIAEMAIQEIRFRIQALNEDIRRADELHELQLALATAQASTSELAVDFIQEKKRQSLRLLTLVQPALKARRRLKTSAQDLTKCSMIIAKVQVISRPHFRSRL
ncbi:uncharacterized protein [Mycetomoellerius zeteki]|uniref:uncharacterized protein n=1 Tax=Mycetomoellerius zeteki TaxID=64791 RepID=UPI00084EB928|nr:PREDICTED: uncharacterized protein LOC108729336 [Trachymyrmex zeteki]